MIYVRNNIVKIFLPLFLFNFCILNAQEKEDDFQSGVFEIKYSFSESYAPPKVVNFVFTGNPQYIDYYYSDLEKRLLRKFTQHGIKVSFRYLNKEPHFTFGRIEDLNEQAIFYLNIQEAETIDEKYGYDRTVVYKLTGNLVEKDGMQLIFKFESKVFGIHDITNQNVEVANYLFEKLYAK